MKMKRVALAIVAGIGLTAVLTYQHWPSSMGSVVLKAHPDYTTVPSAMAVLTEREPMPRTAAAAASTPVKAAWPLQSKYAKVDELMKAGTPQAKYEAYTMIYDCMEAEKLVPDATSYVTKRCGSGQDAVSAGQKSARIELLKAGAEAGMRRAWFALYLESGGYFGDGYFPDTPENKAFLDATYKVAVDNADPVVLVAEIKRLSGTGKQDDQVLALKYQVALATILHKDAGETLLFPMKEPSVKRLAEGLPSALVAATVSEGQQYAQRRTN